MTEPTPKTKTGLWVLHLFCHLDRSTENILKTSLDDSDPMIDSGPIYQLRLDQRFDILQALKSFLDKNILYQEYDANPDTDDSNPPPGHNQVISIAILGHKADVAFMALSKDPWHLKELQNEISDAGLKITDSYLSLTELSEYADGIPEEMKSARLYPTIPPDQKPIWCFYPMSKLRGETNNWFSLPYEERKNLMLEHGTSGRKFSGRVLQVVTGSTGIDDYEWGVTLFCDSPESLKEVVYTLRFDAASAIYAEFGPFYTGVVESPEKIIDSLLSIYPFDPQ